VGYSAIAFGSYEIGSWCIGQLAARPPLPPSPLPQPIPAARRLSQQALAAYVEGYRKHRADVAKGTNTNYGIVGKRLLAFFPGDRLLHTITESETDRWLVWLKTEYAGPTVSKSVKVARQFWAQAIRD
jgi:hypothetical protein